MKASVSPALLTLGILAASSCLLWGDVDLVVQKDGQRREGEILGMRENTLRIKIGPAETGIPLANIASVAKEEPAAFSAALDSWTGGDTQATINALKPLVENFRGLPTPWAERATALLGEAYLEAGDNASAEAAFAAFGKSYPAASAPTAIGLARLAIAKKDYATAKSKIEPLVATALSTKFPESDKSSVYGQALFLMGQIQEASSQNAEALQNYLLASTIFYADKSVSSRAEERAQALMKKGVIVP